MASLDSTKTLSALINYTDIYDINNVAFLHTTGYLVVKSTTAFQKFYPYVKDYLSSYRVTDDQREKYRYRPDLLSSDVYGTPMLGWLIMWMNGQECPSKFRIKQTIVLINPSQIQDVFITIKAKNQKALDANWLEHQVT